MIAIPRLDTRQVVFVVLTGLVVLCAMVTERYIFPLYDELDLARSRAATQSGRHVKLTRDLAVSRTISAEFEKLGKGAEQTENDHVTLSNFLRDLETLARYPTMTIINIKPLPVEDGGSHRVYRARLAVSGKLQEILQFVSDLVSEMTTTGVESFSLRGIQGGTSRIECVLSLRRIRVVPKDRKGSGSPRRDHITTEDGNDNE